MVTENLRIRDADKQQLESVINYKGSSPYANFLTTNFITAIFQNFPKNALAKYLANVKLGYCNFFPEPKAALGKDPLYETLMKLQNPNDIRNSQNLTLYTPADDVPLSLDF